MKKLFLFLAVFMITVSSFAWRGTFRTSCGVILSVDNPSVNSVSDVVSYLQALNGRQCGYSNVSITFS